MSWPGLLVFLCEMRQVLSCPSVGAAGVCRLLAARPEDYLAVCRRFNGVYQRSASYGRQCHLVRLFLVALLAVDSAQGD